MLSAIDEGGSKIDRNSVFDCHLSQCGDKWQSKTLFIKIFDLRSDLQIRVSTGKLAFLFLNQNICCGYSKELSQ